MKQSYVIVTLDLIDTIPGFFRLLTEFVGVYTITQRPEDVMRKDLQIFFMSNEEGQVDFQINQTDCGYKFSWV